MDARLLLAGLCGWLQFIACLIAAAALSLLPALGDRPGWLLIVAVPALSSAIMPLVAVLRPNVFAVGRLAFPLNVTLPVIHGALMVTVSLLMLTTKVGVMAVPARMSTFGAWTEPTLWLAAVATQIVVLSIAVRLRRRMDR